MNGNTNVVVIGGGYAGAMAANRLTRRGDVRVTLVNPRPTFVHRIRLHQLVGGTDSALLAYEDLPTERVRLVVDTVTRIDAADRGLHPRGRRHTVIRLPGLRGRQRQRRPGGSRSRGVRPPARHP